MNKPYFKISFLEALICCYIGLAPILDYFLSRQFGITEIITTDYAVRSSSIPIFQFLVIPFLLMQIKLSRAHNLLLFLYILLMLSSLRIDNYVLLIFGITLYSGIVAIWLHTIKNPHYGINIMFLSAILVGVIAFIARIYIEGVSFERARYGLNALGGFPLIMILVCLLQYNFQRGNDRIIPTLLSLIVILALIYSSRTGMFISAIVLIGWLFRKISSQIRITLRGLFVFSITVAIFLSIPSELINLTKQRFNIFQNSVDTSSFFLTLETISYWRIDPWLEGLSLITHNPILGIGFGRYFLYSQNGWSNPHNEILAILIENGWIIGSLVIFFVILSMLPRIRAGITGWSFFFAWFIGMFTGGFGLIQFPGIISSYNLILILVLLMPVYKKKFPHNNIKLNQQIK